VVGHKGRASPAGCFEVDLTRTEPSRKGRPGTHSARSCLVGRPRSRSCRLHRARSGRMTGTSRWLSGAARRPLEITPRTRHVLLSCKPSRSDVTHARVAAHCMRPSFKRDPVMRQPQQPRLQPACHWLANGKSQRDTCGRGDQIGSTTYVVICRVLPNRVQISTSQALWIRKSWGV
jgi:hypothetical protein